MAVVVEKRRFARREVGLVIEIGCSRHDAEAIRSVTSNIGTGGLLFRTPRWRDFPVGEQVDVSILFPARLDCASWHCSRLCASGKVIRHQKGEGMPDSDWRGVAVTFDTPVTLN